MSRMTILTEAELRKIVKLDLDAVACVENAFRALATLPVAMPPILRLDIPEHRGEVDVKTAYVPGIDGFAIKISPGFFDNPKLGLPSVNGMMVLLSPKTGLVEALLLDNGYLTDVRTAAAGAVAAKHLSRADSSVAAIFGAGVQARLQLEALTLVRPIAEARIWARDAAKAEAAADALREALGIVVRAEPDRGKGGGRRRHHRHHDAVDRAADQGRLGLGRPAHHRDGLGRRAQERDRAGDPAASADLYVADSAKQTRRLGELHHAIAAGLIAADAEIAELGQIIAGASQGRRSADRHHHRRPHRHRRAGHGDRHARPRPCQGGERRHDFRKLIPAARPNKRGPRTMQPNLKFSRGEYADRLAKTRKAMEAKGVDLLVRQRSRPTWPG